MYRVPVISTNGKPLMPTKCSRARRWIKEGKAVGKFNKLGQFYVQLLVEPSGDETQPIAIGLDPGKHYSGVGVQSTKNTLWTGHIELPLLRVRERMDNRKMMRRGRRGRRINRKLPFSQRAHLRQYLKLEKSQKKSEQTPNSHAVDGVTLACFKFLEYKPYFSGNIQGHSWQGEVNITNAPFTLIKRPPISRRQLHLMVLSKGSVRRKYGGTTTRHSVRKGDFVKAEKSGQIYFGWVSGDTEKQISVSDFNWKRIAQFTATKVQFISRSTGLICKNLYGGRAFLSR
jgi:hypothetical protein